MTTPGEKIQVHPETGTWRKQQTHPSGATRTVYSTDEGGSWAPRGEATPAPKPATPAPAKRSSTWLEDAIDFGRGAGQGATLNWGEEGSAALLEHLPDPDGDPTWLGEMLGVEGGAPYVKAERPGADEAMLEHMRTENAESQEDSPVLYGAGEMAGAAPLAIAAGGALPAVGAGGTALTRTAARGALGATEGGTFGAVTGAGMADENTRLEGAETGAMSGALGGAGGATVLPAAAGALRRGAEKVGAGARVVADRARAGATGAYGGALKKYGKDRGPDAIGDFGANVERLGIHEGEGLGSSLPQSWETYARNATRVKNESGAKIGELSEIADQAGVRVDIGEIAAELMDEAAELRKLPAREAHAQADELVRRATDFGLESRVNGKSYGEAHKLRMFLDDLAWDADVALQSKAAERARNVASKLRKRMDASLEGVDPALRDAMREANTAYGTSKQAKKYADDRLAQEAGNQVLSLPSVAMAAGGYGGGGPLGAVAGSVAGQLMKTRGSAATAGTARGIQRMSQATADTLTPAVTSRAADVAQGAGALGGAFSAAPEIAVAVDTADKVQRMARQASERLGPFRTILAEAEQQGNFAVAHSQLQQSDPEYQAMLAEIEQEEYDQ